MTRLPSISSLMSPPEAKPLDSFSPTLNSADQPYKTQPRSLSPDNRLAPISNSHSPATSTMRILPSPPVSPWLEKPVYKGNSMDGGPGNISGISTNRDIILYPTDSDTAEIPADQPLFPLEPSIEDETVAKHISMHMAQFDKKLNRPTREEYLLALSCIPNIGRVYNRNPGAYMKRTHDETQEQYWKAKRICAKPGTKAMPLINIAPAPAVRQPKKAIKPVTGANPIPRVKRTPKASPKSRLLAYSPKGRSATPETRTPATKRPEDVDFNSLPDFSPPTSTLPKGNPKSLKADWPSSNLLNLSNDPDRALLHEAELNLASTLRLSCATYLCSKRRIFEGRLNALRINKEFRKTDAQQACKIDVNKASKLWTAYDKVGWFNEAHFDRFL
ncbi:hypothetical protein MMC22_005124 [Lobaria immixta]|nr:hypothetical protein [Lobaria immixta]